jgi:hypothetical protein
MQPLCTSFIGFFVGAALSWNSAATIEKESLIDLLNVHVFGDDTKTIGALLYDLGNLYLETGEDANRNGTIFGRLLPNAQYAIPATTTVGGLENVKEKLIAVKQKVSALQGTM